MPQVRSRTRQSYLIFYTDNQNRCGEAGHKARECPTDPEGPMKCFNCGQEGYVTTPITKIRPANSGLHSHAKSDCTNPRVFTGTCRRCEKQGHPASECPDKPPVKCFNCKEEGKVALSI